MVMRRTPPLLIVHCQHAILQITTSRYESPDWRTKNGKAIRDASSVSFDHLWFFIPVFLMDPERMTSVKSLGLFGQLQNVEYPGSREKTNGIPNSS
eukprot:s71_g25.t1